MPSSLESIGSLLQTISAPARLEILLLVGAGEACVCHIESRLGYRQAYISQHLMVMRQAGLIDSRRDGRYVFYRLLKPEILPLIQQAAEILSVSLPEIAPVSPQEQCAYFIETIESQVSEPQEQLS